MKIIDVKFNKFDLGNRPEPWHDATFTESSLSFSLTQVITDDGLIGYAPSALNPGYVSTFKP